MATLRKANAYSKKKVTPFTRKSKKRSKSFIKTVPQSKIVKFKMGQGKIEKLPHRLTLVCTEKVQLRHNALEACRQFVNKKIDKQFSGNYIFKIVPYPHHVQRENKMLTGAGADRMQTGMQLAYGKSAGKAAILKDGSKLFVVAVENERNIAFVRKAFKQIKAKLPCKTRTVYENLGSKK
tara:strand:- start:68 stop:607 length:540 start_codon:yes stop_codon:yes gene_type:complete